MRLFTGFPFTKFLMGPCFYCGLETYRLGPKNNHPQKYTRDHLVPRRLRVNVTEYDPLSRQFTVTCCNRCNNEKGCQSAAFFIQLKGTATPIKLRQIDRVYSFYAEARNEKRHKKRREKVWHENCNNNDAKSFASQQEECHANAGVHL